jgi:tetratricopeptide (TPR) repeat protein
MYPYERHRSIASALNSGRILRPSIMDDQIVRIVNNMLKNRMLRFFFQTKILYLLLLQNLLAQVPVLNNFGSHSVATALFSETISTSSPKIVLIIARPASSESRFNPEFPWISAFVHEYLLFRLAAVTDLKIVDPDSLTSMISEYRSYRDPSVSESSYLSKSESVNATHILLPECTLQKNNSAVQISMKVTPLQDNNAISVQSSTSDVAAIDKALDACISQLLSGFQIEPSAAVQKFLKTKVAGNGKCDKTIGTLVSTVYSGKKQNFKGVAEDLKKCASGEESALLANYLSARFFARASDFNNAATILKEVIFKLGPTDAALYPLCAGYFHKANRLENGIQMVKVAEGLGLGTNDLIVEKALLLQAMEEENDAAAAFREVLKFDPSNFNALLFLMHYANKTKDATLAIDYANRFRQLFPGDGRGDLEAGKAYFAVQQIPDAQSALVKAVDILTANAEPLILLGDVYAAQSNHTAALDQYERALDLAPGDVDLHVKIAQTCLLMGKPEMAVETLKKIQKNNYDNSGLLKTLGLAEYQTGDTAGARKELSRYIQSGTPDHTVFFTLGEIYDNAGEYSEALDNYERAAALDQTDRITPERIEAVKRKMGGSEYTEKVKKKKERRESAERGKHVSPKLVIQVGSGVVGVAAISGGYFMNMLLDKDYKVYKNWTTYPEAQNTQRVNELHNSISQKMLYRNILYGVAGICTISMSMTFVIH